MDAFDVILREPQATEESGNARARSDGGRILRSAQNDFNGAPNAAVTLPPTPYTLERNRMSETVGSEYVYRGKVVTLRIDTIRMPDGHEAKREVVEHHGAVAIVPRKDDETVLLIRQFRQAVGETLLEIPAGTLEPGEDADACAARELEEEIGYRPGKLRRMFSQYLAPGYSNEVLHAYLGEDLIESQVNPDADEEIEIVPVKVADIEAMILDGRIKDAKSIAALLVALRLL